MFGGAMTVMAAIAWIVILIAAQHHAASDFLRAAMSVLTDGGWPLAAGIVVMVVGRAVYGHWRTAAPVVNVTGEVARTVGLVVAGLLAAILVFILATGFGHDDTGTIAALAVGIAFGVWVAQFGGNLRGRGYLD